jgi:hypothetical protein
VPTYDDQLFEQQLARALQQVEIVLGETKRPRVASDVHHAYDDKFLLAEVLTAMSWAALRTTLEGLGLNANTLATLRGWPSPTATVLRFSGEERCTLDRTEDHELVSPAVRTEDMKGGKTRTIESKIVKTVTKYYWRFSSRYAITATSLLDAAVQETIRMEEGVHEIVTTTEQPPRPEVTRVSPAEVALGPLLEGHDDQLLATVRIDRDHPECHTPRRNPQVDDALESLAAFRAFFQRIQVYLTNELFPLDEDGVRDPGVLWKLQTFVPVLPLLIDTEEEQADVQLARGDLDALLAHQGRTLEQAHDEIAKLFASDDTLVSRGAAEMVVLSVHGMAIADSYARSATYLEGMLERQLAAAIGKELSPVDFSTYMEFHARKLFAHGFEPVAFHHAVRRPEHVPEGVIAIEQLCAGEWEPIRTFVRAGEASRPMHVALNAATRVALHGDRYVHGWVDHQFAGQRSSELRVTARAREFSGFVLLLGRIVSAELFEPKAALILQNKDDLRLPLAATAIPSPQEFKDAIQSLSPEQQRFARAYRSMQLESTLFGVVVLQIKPQLEVLLKLPDDSLTKEIRLTQQLLELLIRYQLPSDLLTYTGPEDATDEEKVGVVAGHVERMMALLQEQKDAELEAQRLAQAQSFAEVEAAAAVQVHHYRGPPPGFGPGGAGAPPPQAGAAPMPAMAMSPGPPAAPAMRSAGAPPAAMAAPPVVSAPSLPIDAMMAAEPAPSPSPVVATAGPTPDDDEGGDGEDYTELPVLLDQRFDELDEDDALRPTILEIGKTWTLSRRRSLVSKPVETELREAQQREERDRAFDLLDALSRSGSLPLHHASLHVLLASTHGFDRTLVETIIQRSDNPIEKVERSALIVASTIHQQPAEALIRSAARARLEASATLPLSPSTTEGVTPEGEPTSE